MKHTIQWIITYGAEAISNTKSSKNNRNKDTRVITEYTLSDRQRNSDISQRDDILRWINQRRREWNQHVSRMINDRMANIIRINTSHWRTFIGGSSKWRQVSWQSTGNSSSKRRRRWRHENCVLSFDRYIQRKLEYNERTCLDLQSF